MALSSLATNNIRQLEDSAFSAVQALYSLDLQDCSIANISGAAFAGLASLRHLKLASNALTRNCASITLQPKEPLEKWTLYCTNVSGENPNDFLPILKIAIINEISGRTVCRSSKILIQTCFMTQYLQTAGS